MKEKYDSKAPTTFKTSNVISEVEIMPNVTKGKVEMKKRAIVILFVAVTVLLVAFGVLTRKNDNTANVLDKETAAVYALLLDDRFYENDFKGIMYNQSIPQYKQSFLDLGVVWKQTALCDITGDGKPELFFGRHIYTCDNGVAKDITGKIYINDANHLCDGLCATTNNNLDSFDTNILGSIEIASTHHDAFYRVAYYCDDVVAVDIYKYELDNRGNLHKTMQFGQAFSDENHEAVYSVNGKEIDEDVFARLYDSLGDDLGDTINYSIRNHESLNNPYYSDPLIKMNLLAIFKDLEGTEILAKEYSEMIEYLEEVAEIEIPIQSKEKSGFYSIDGVWGVPGKASSRFCIRQDRTALLKYNTEFEIPCWWDVNEGLEFSVYDLELNHMMTLVWDDDNDRFINKETGTIYYKQEA